MKCSWNKSYEKYIGATSTSNNIYIIETINYTINYKFNLPFKCYGIQWIPKQSVYVSIYNNNRVHLLLQLILEKL